MLDEDETVKELAAKTIEELWFYDGPSAPSSSQRTRSSTLGPTQESQLKVTVIMGVSSNFRDRQSPLEDLLHKIMVDKDMGETSALQTRYKEICDTLIDGLVDATELPGFVSPAFNMVHMALIRSLDRHQLRSDHPPFCSILPGSFVSFECFYTLALLKESDLCKL